jgi:glycosyltransferase involved in cell wall biosynthesis
VEPRDPEQLAERILHLLERPELARAMAENNSRLAPQFAPEAVAEEYLAIYRASGRQARAASR